jgi:ribosomal protein S18 acetylase RimI-like enzyme
VYFQVVPYRQALRSGLETLCCETGFLGSPIDRVFKDTRLFSKYLTGYYLSVEPDLAFVALDPNGAVIGYIVGSVRRWRYRMYRATRLPGFVAAVLGKIILGRYDKASLRFCLWLFLKGWREIPKAPLHGAHFHFNVQGPYRNSGVAKALLEQFLKEVARRGEDVVYGQMLTFETRRRAELYRRLGWKVFDRTTVSKYSTFLRRRIYLTTIYRSIKEQGTRVRFLPRVSASSFAGSGKEGRLSS